MSLTIFRSDCSDARRLSKSVVKDNDSFFDVYTDLTNSSIAVDILMGVDEARFNSDVTFVGRTPDVGALNKMCLSTGTKTLLNIIQHPDVCFDVSECGINALQFIPRIKDGIIIWRFPLIPYRGKKDCDILYEGILYSNFSDFLNVIYKEDRG